ncbi:MAG: hypothetical protein R2809_07840 [Flavobacteriales bacterium]
MSEEKFFQNVKSSLYDFAPEVPQSVYGGMRRKLWWSNFMTWNWASLNVWYVLLLVGIGTGVALSGSEESIQANKAIESPVNSTKMEMPVLELAAETTTSVAVAISSSKNSVDRKLSPSRSVIDPAIQPSVAVTDPDPSTNPECNLPVVETPESTTTEAINVENTVVEEPKVSEPLKGKTALEVEVYINGN